ncbi:oxysterol-binding protein-related protein 7 isoform X3 [Chamaea fasciata]|uniref:oxysterol-binding protein-related protein 7 isoform X3 n=1 Tax=Chamaea fasciata TaxID=190680 RepID=UPI00336A2D4B
MQSPPGAGDGRIAVTPRPGQAADAVAELPDLPSPPRSGSRRDGPARSPGPAAPTGRAARPAASRPVRSPAMGSHEKDPSSPRRALSRSNSTVSSKHSSVQQGSESWEVVEEPRGRGSPGRQPHRHEGYLLKKRKWPLKGWHKRYFVLENGILKYSTTRQDVLKGKLHGAIDVRQSVMSVNKKAQRVDLDTEDNIYHLKIKSPEVFSSWVSSLCTHHHGERPEPCPPGGPSAQGQWTRMLPSGSAPALSTLASSRDKVNAWLKDSEGLERCSAELSECQAKLQELTGMLQHLEALHRIPSAPLISGSQPSGATERPKKGRRSTRIWCTQSFAKDDTIGRVRVGRLHGSVPNLSRYLEPSQSQLPFSLPPEYSQLQRSFWVLAQKVHGSLSSVVAALVAERARLEEMRQTLDRQGPAPRPGTTGPGLRRFHSLSVSSDTTLDSFASLHPDEPDSLPAKGREQQLSNRSIVSLADSHTEFFDACEVFLSASSSENEPSEDESCLSEVTAGGCEETTEPGGPGRPPTAPLRGAGVQRAARQSQPRPRPPAAPGVRGRLRRVRLRLHLLPGGLQTLQPRAGRDLRVREAGQRLPLHQRAGVPPPSRLRLPRRVGEFRLLARHEVEEQILGQILGDRPRGHRQRPVTQDRGPLRVEQGDHVHPQRAERAALDRALRGGADPEHPRRLLPLQAHLLQGAVLGRGGQRGAGRGAEPRRRRRGAPGRQVARGAAPRARAGTLRLESQPHAPRPREELRLHAVRAGAERADAGAAQGAALHGHAAAAGPAVPGGGERAGGRGAEAPDRAAAARPAPRHGGEQHHPPGPLLQAPDGRQREGVLGHQQHLLEAAPGPRLRPPGQRRALVAPPKPRGGPC